MKMPDEIKKGLEYCHSAKPCADCSYDKRDFPHCVRRLLGDALDGYKQLESLLAQAERERDAAVSDMRTEVKTNAVCIACKHDRPFDNNCEENDFDCANCKSPCMCQSCHLGSNYEWRGICAENSKEEN